MTAYRTQANTGADTLVTTKSVTTPGGVVAGDVGVFWLVRWETGGSFPAVTPPSGAVLRGTILNGTEQTLCYLHKYTSESSFTFSWTGSRWSTVDAQWFSGVDPALDLSTAPFQSATGSGTAVSTLTVTTVDTAALVWLVNTIATSSSTHVPPTSFTETADISAWAAAYRISPGSGSQSASSATISPTGPWAAGLVALAPASGATPSGSDTGTGTEAQSLAATLSNQDTSAITEGIPTIRFTATDAAAGTETNSLAVSLSNQDTGSATESQSLAQANAETSFGTDAQSIVVSISSSDSGIATETNIIHVSSSDSASTTDSGSLAVSLSNQDTSTALEGITRISFVNTDAGSATDTQSISAQMSSVETVSGTENQSSQASLTQSDSAVGVDLGSTNTDAQKAGSDTASATEDQIVYIISSDGVTATDSQSLSATVAQADSAALLDLWIVSAALASTDVLAATEFGQAEEAPEDTELSGEFSAPFIDPYFLSLTGSEIRFTLKTYTEEVGE